MARRLPLSFSVNSLTTSNEGTALVATRAATIARIAKTLRPDGKRSLIRRN
jgi:hypothetical protein